MKRVKTAKTKLFANESKTKTAAFKVAAALLALCVWEIVALLVDSSMLLASPYEVAVRLFEILSGSESVMPPILFSFVRITVGFFSALVLGTLLASLAGRFRTAEILLAPYMTTIKAVPVASFIVLALIWFTSGTLSAFTSFLMVLPVVYTNILHGIKSIDTKMIETARVFRIPWGRRLMYIWLPQIKPHLISACSVGFGFAWKSGVAAEIIGIPQGSIGERLYYAKLYFDSAELIAWTAIIIALSIVSEKLLMLALKYGYKALYKA